MHSNPISHSIYECKREISKSTFKSAGFNRMNFAIAFSLNEKKTESNAMKYTKISKCLRFFFPQTEITIFSGNETVEEKRKIEHQAHTNDG